ncbi:MAG: hypothetical protein AAFN81_12955 [Bacteroidota bacterium]
MNRRKALHLTTLGSLGVMVKGFGKNELIYLNKGKEVVLWAPIISFAARFALGVATSVAARLVYDYIREKRNGERGGTCGLPAGGAISSNTIEQENQNLRRRGFTDLSESTVYCNNEVTLYSGKKTELFLPDQTNARTPIFCNRRKVRVISFQGPDLIGVGLIAEETKRGSDAATARDYFQPQSATQYSSGSFENGYTSSSQYRSRNGTEVEIDYQRIPYYNKGLVKVVASKGYNRLVDKEYEVRFA